MSFARTDRSLVAQWWWTIDRWSIAALAIIIGFGALLIMASSPAVALRIHAGGLHPDDLFFVKRYFAVLPASLALMFVVSLQTPRMVRRIALVGFVISLVLLAYTLFGGVEIKGARRWIELPGLSLQPSEFVKPCFAVVCAWLFSQYRLRENFPGHWIAMLLYLTVVTLLIKQPDLGQTALVSVVWFTQFFLAGLRLYWVAAGMASGVVGLVGAYITLPHVASRIDRFLDPASGDSYQVDRSMDAFMNGGLWAAARAKARSRNRCPTRTPISSSPSPARSLASSPASSSSRSSPLSCSAASRGCCRRPTSSSCSPPPASSCSSGCRRSSTWHRPCI